MKRPATVYLNGVPLPVTWEELTELKHLAADNPNAAVLLAKKYLEERSDSASVV